MESIFPGYILVLAYLTIRHARWMKYLLMKSSYPPCMYPCILAYQNTFTRFTWPSSNIPLKHWKVITKSLFQYANVQITYKYLTIQYRHMTIKQYSEYYILLIVKQWKIIKNSLFINANVQMCKYLTINYCHRGYLTIKQYSEYYILLISNETINNETIKCKYTNMQLCK